MINKNIINKGLAKILILASFSLIFLSGCIPNNQYQPATKTKKPGLYNITGWNYSNCYFPSKKLGTCSSKDIDGKVGYELYVGGLRANCVPSGKWSTSGSRITSGTLPPGLTFEKGKSVIRGIPEKRGHWIIHIKVDNLYCGGTSYYGLEQDLRFHISGSGKVTY